MIVTVRDTEVYRASFRTPEWIDIQFSIPAEVIDRVDVLELEFSFPLAVAPIALGGSIDARVLGVAVFRLKLEECETKGTRDIGGVHRLPVDVELGDPVKVAAVCMTYNEPELVPHWVEHYARHVGRENCFILDDGSSDKSTFGLGACNVIRLPRKPYNPGAQSEFNSAFCTNLLHYYDYVLYSDVDEFIIPDPRVAETISEYCRRPLPPVITMIGLNIVHLPNEEPPWDAESPLLAQRKFVRFVSSMCKPTLVRQPVIWSPGSHSANARTIFDHLYLFHAKFFDLPASLRRLQTTREMAWAQDHWKGISRAQDTELVGFFNSVAAMPKLTGVDFDPLAEPVSGYLERVLESRLTQDRHTYKIALDIVGDELWEIPTRFKGTAIRCDQ